MDSRKLGGSRIYVNVVKRHWCPSKVDGKGKADIRLERV
jgi:hypothetical protein